MGFPCNHLGQVVYSPRLERPRLPSALGSSIVYTARPRVPTVGAHLQGCAGQPSSVLCGLPTRLSPRPKGRRHFRWTDHAASQDAVSALTYHRILQCNSRCPQDARLTEPRILAPMGCLHRCDHPAASPSTVRKGRPSPGAQTLIPHSQGPATRAPFQPAIKYWGPFRCRSVDADAI